MATVKNAVETSDLSCKCGTWISHWEKNYGYSASYCSVSTCMEQKDLVGGHVKKVNSTDTAMYIIPLCKSHNASNDNMEVPDAKLVTATKGQKC
jgi:hypothetical protein